MVYVSVGVFLGVCVCGCVCVGESGVFLFGVRVCVFVRAFACVHVRVSVRYVRVCECVYLEWYV